MTNKILRTTVLTAIFGLLFAAFNLRAAAQDKPAKPPEPAKPAVPSEPAKPEIAKPEPAKPEAAKPPTPPEKPATKPNDDGTLELEFPDVEGWTRDPVYRYPTEELGYSVNYNSKTGGRITIYVYNGGRKTIPNEVGDKVLKQEIENAENDIAQAQKLGAYESVKKLKSEQIVLGGASGKIKALRSQFALVVQERKLDSDIYLFAFKNHFIKIRATRLHVEGETTNEAVALMLSEIDKLFTDFNLLSTK